VTPDVAGKMVLSFSDPFALELNKQMELDR
jgi:hypothetical protein